MVRRAKRTTTPARSVGIDAEQRLDGRRLDRLGLGHVRQDAGQAFRKHALARPRRTHEQQVVATGRGYLERTPCMSLAENVGQVGRAARPGGRRRGRCNGQRLGTLQVRRDLQQRARRVYRAAGQRGLPRVVGGYDDGPAGGESLECGGQDGSPLVQRIDRRIESDLGIALQCALKPALEAGGPLIARYLRQGRRPGTRRSSPFSASSP